MATLNTRCGAAALFLQFWSQVPGFTFVDHAFAFKPGAWILTTGMLLVGVQGAGFRSREKIAERRHERAIALAVEMLDHLAPGHVSQRAPVRQQQLHRSSRIRRQPELEAASLVEQHVQ